jgi:hypothetical protein
MGEMNNWQYFRKEALNGEAPEIFTDNESKSKKYERILMLLVVFMPILMINLNNLKDETDPFFQVLGFIFFCFFLLYTYGIIRIGARVLKLRKKL